MQVKVNIKIDAPSDDVWDVLVNKFDQNQEWMSAVPKSYAKDGKAVSGAKVKGRICELKNDPSKIIADETITKVDKEKLIFHFDIIARNVPKKFPIKSNHVTVSLSEDSGSTEVVWTASPVLNGMIGHLAYLPVRLGMTKSFSEVLEELKHYVETGERLPRKVAADEKYGIKNR